jgi:hypothetical protein
MIDCTEREQLDCGIVLLPEGGVQAEEVASWMAAEDGVTTVVVLKSGRHLVFRIAPEAFAARVCAALTAVNTRRWSENHC